MLDLLDLPREWFPPALESGAVSGTTDAGVPVAAGGGDQAAGALGVGVDRPGSVSVALGTSGVVFGVLPALAADPRGTAHTFCHAVPGTLACDGRDAVGGRGARLAARLRRARACRSRRCSMRRRRGSRDARASSSPRTSSGERTPHADPARPRRVRGAQPCATTRARSCGPCSRASPMACATRSSSCAASAFARRPAGSGGGGSRSELWRRIVASVLDLPLESHRGDDARRARRSDARRRRRRLVRRRAAAVESCVRVIGRVEPDPAWRRSVRRGLCRIQAHLPRDRRPPCRRRVSPPGVESGRPGTISGWSPTSELPARGAPVRRRGRARGARRSVRARGAGGRRGGDGRCQRQEDPAPARCAGARRRPT